MMDWNLSIVQSLAASRTPFGLSFFSHMTEFGGLAVTVVVLVVAMLLLWRGRSWAHSLGLLVALGGATIVAHILKIALAFPRPDQGYHAVIENGYSFPSAHAAAAMALYGFLAWYVWEIYPRWGIPASLLFGILIMTIGFSRVYLGVHFPTDVIVGFAIGAVFIWIGATITARLERF